MAALHFCMHIKGMYSPVLQSLPVEKFNTDSLYAALFSQKIGGYIWAVPYIKVFTFMFLLLYSSRSTSHNILYGLPICLPDTDKPQKLWWFVWCHWIFIRMAFWWTLQGKCSLQHTIGNWIISHIPNTAFPTVSYLLHRPHFCLTSQLDFVYKWPRVIIYN